MLSNPKCICKSIWVLNVNSMLGLYLKTINIVIQHLIIRYRSNLGADILVSIYIASIITSMLDSCKLILSIAQEIYSPKVILNPGIQATLLYHIEVYITSEEAQSCCNLYQSGSKTILLAGIDQASQHKVVFNTVDPGLDSLIVYPPLIHRWSLQLDGMQENLGKQSSIKRLR